MYTQCDYGTYQPGGLTQCQPCPGSPFYTPVDGNGSTIASTATTLFRGAFGPEACVSISNQLSPEAGQSYFSPESPLQPLLQAGPQVTLEACLSTCAADRCCLAQYVVNSSSCQTITLAPASPASTTTSSSSIQLMYKLPANSLAAASSVKGPSSSQGAAGAEGAEGVAAKTLQSGYYATCSVPAADLSAWLTGAGSRLGPDARTFSASITPVWDTNKTLQACKAQCDESNVCWGFFWDAGNAACLYRGGVDALATRAFFVMPRSVDLGTLAWATALVAAPACANTTNGSISVSSGGNSSSTLGGTNSSAVNSGSTNSSATNSTGTNSSGTNTSTNSSSSGSPLEAQAPAAIINNTTTNTTTGSFTSAQTVHGGRMHA